MESKNLLIVFVKNAIKGHAKTRLAKSIGDDKAFEIYKELLSITERETSKVQNCKVHIYFSSELDESRWKNCQQFVQSGNDLGERMGGAFQNGFDLGFEKIIGIGSDLPELTSEIIYEGFEKLEDSDCVFGPAEDGGYYLLGMKEYQPCIFEDKPWSTDKLFELTKNELLENGRSVSELVVLNDLDTLEDLEKSKKIKSRILR